MKNPFYLFKRLSLIDANGTTLEVFNVTEEIYDKQLNYSGAPFPYLAYGLNGYVQSVCVHLSFFSIRSY
jgi:hypothetical protein